MSGYVYALVYEKKLKPRKYSLSKCGCGFVESFTEANMADRIQALVKRTSQILV
jgi:hypothetical protein